MHCRERLLLCPQIYFYLLIFLCVVCVCVFLGTYTAKVLGSRKSVPDPTDPELQGLLSYLTWVLRTEFWSSGYVLLMATLSPCPPFISSLSWKPRRCSSLSGRGLLAAISSQPWFLRERKVWTRVLAAQSLCSYGHLFFNLHTVILSLSCFIFTLLSHLNTTSFLELTTGIVRFSRLLRFLTCQVNAEDKHFLLLEQEK